MEHIAFVGVGSNIDAYRNCVDGIRDVVADPRAELLALSSLYRTSPVSPIPQDDFLNCVIKIGWKGDVFELLSFLESVERKTGRRRDVPLGPRTLDLDILFFDDLILDIPRLTVPHSRLHERKFVLVPCLEIDENLIHPLLKLPLRQLLAAIGNEQKIEVYKKIAKEELIRPGIA